MSNYEVAEIAARFHREGEAEKAANLIVKEAS
jgi:hypothetical protein